jgi:hypothetical protein
MACATNSLTLLSSTILFDLLGSKYIVPSLLIGRPFLVEGASRFRSSKVGPHTPIQCPLMWSKSWNQSRIHVHHASGLARAAAYSARDALRLDSPSSTLHIKIDCIATPFQTTESIASATSLVLAHASGFDGSN